MTDIKAQGVPRQAPMTPSRHWVYTVPVTPAIRAVRTVLALLFAGVFVLFTGIFAPAPAQADNLNSSVKIVAEIQDDGSAIVTEKRSFEVDSGTEYYLSWGNLSDSRITQANVVLDGQQLEDVGEWDIDRSRQEKAGQFGMRDVGSNQELSFGFSDYGQHTAQITYRVTNLVKNLEDGPQAMYWFFIPPDTMDIEHLDVTVTNSVGFTFSQDNSKIWSFGFEGSADITASGMTMASSKALGADDYAVMLAVWPDAPFQTSSTLSETTETLTDRAFEGSDYASSGGTGDGSSALKVMDVVTIVIAVLGVCVVVALLVVWFIGRKRRTFVADHSAFGSDPTQPHRFMATVPPDFYWRDVPYYGSPLDVCSMVGTVIPGAVDATLLKWMLSDHVRVVQQDSGHMSGGPVGALHLNPAAQPVFASPAEQELWNIFREGAGPDAILMPDEFTQRIQAHTDVMLTWAHHAKANSENLMVQRGLIHWGTTRYMGKNMKTLSATPSGVLLVNQSRGFMNFIREFSLLEERSAINVKLWDHYMIWAAMFGIADQARAEFEKIYPQYRAESAFSDFSMGTISSMSRAVSIAYSHRTLSDGDPGFSSALSKTLGHGGSSSVGGRLDAFGRGSGGGIRS